MPEFDLPVIFVTGFTLIATIAWSDVARAVMKSISPVHRIESPMENLRYAVIVTIIVYGVLYIADMFFDEKHRRQILNRRTSNKKTDNCSHHHHHHADEDA